MKEPSAKEPAQLLYEQHTLAWRHTTPWCHTTPWEKLSASLKDLWREVALRPEYARVAKEANA